MLCYVDRFFLLNVVAAATEYIVFPRQLGKSESKHQWVHVKSIKKYLEKTRHEYYSPYLNMNKRSPLLAAVSTPGLVFKTWGKRTDYLIKNMLNSTFMLNNSLRVCGVLVMIQECVAISKIRAGRPELLILLNYIKLVGPDSALQFWFHNPIPSSSTQIKWMRPVVFKRWLIDGALPCAGPVWGWIWAWCNRDHCSRCTPNAQTQQWTHDDIQIRLDLNREAETMYR